MPAARRGRLGAVRVPWFRVGLRRPRDLPDSLFGGDNMSGLDRRSFTGVDQEDGSRMWRQSLLTLGLVGFLFVPTAQPKDPKPPVPDADYVKVEVRGTLKRFWERVEDEGKNKGKTV